MLTLFVLDAACSQVTNSVMYQGTHLSNKVAQSLNVGRDDLYVVMDVPQLKYELEVCRWFTPSFSLDSYLKHFFMLLMYTTH